MNNLKDIIVEKLKINKETSFIKPKIDINDINTILKNVYYDDFNYMPKGDPSEYIKVYGFKNSGQWKKQSLIYFLKIKDIKLYANKENLFAITDAINKRDDRGFTYSLLLGYDPNSTWGWVRFAILHKQEKKCEWNEELANKFLNK